MNDHSEILFCLHKRVAEVTLNRPHALNALTLEMVRDFDPQLAAWEKDHEVCAVVVRGAGDKAFCAGGDIQKLYDSGPNSAVSREFFWEEYRLNWRIQKYSKPYIAVMDGITMGGGVGLSVHAGTRIAADNTVFAMPETGIGLFPDVGGSWFLPRLPGEIGMFMAMTGARLKAADCLYVGICDAYIPNDRHEEFITALRTGEDVATVVDRLSEPAGYSSIAAYRETIDKCFAGDTVEAFITALKSEDCEWAKKQIDAMASKSPTSQKISCRQLRDGSRLDFESCMIMEYRLAQHLMRGGDFFEGVRALVIDKDNAPNWSPSSLSELSIEDVALYFEPLGELDLKFPF